MHSTNHSDQIVLMNKLARDFGILIAIILICVSAYKLYFNSWPPIYSSGGLLLAFIFLAIGFKKPSMLHIPTKLWMHVGDLLGRFVSPLILGVIFFLMITPIAIVIRLLGRDELSLKRVDAHSYWKTRNPEMQPSKSFNTQY
jgi:hypothetical protein